MTSSESAHLLRRAAMSVDPDLARKLSGRSKTDMVRHLLDADDDRDRAVPVDDDDWAPIVTWWIERMTSSDTGLTDRMTWFWHCLLTTNAWKVPSSGLIAEQLGAMRSLARTDFPTILEAFVGSGALLTYLDAAGSTAARPNENLARELMELYTIGRGDGPQANYSQDDVRAAARALAGWEVEDQDEDEDTERYEVHFNNQNAFIAPLIYLGEQADWDTALVVDHLANHPLTASRIAARLWHHLVGTQLSAADADELGRWWTDNAMAIDPLLERILTSDAFWRSTYSRPRSGLEWYCLMASATRQEVESWHLERLGQMPYLPPTPAGWDDDQWLWPSSLAARSAVAHSAELEELAARHAEMSVQQSVAQIIERCGLDPVSPKTLAALNDVTPSDTIGAESAALVRWRLALTSPEAHLA